MLVAMVVAACSRKVIPIYSPVAGEARISTHEFRERAGTLLPISCPRLIGAQSTTSGEVRILLMVDSAGAVREARLERGSGDTTFDDVLGGLAARLRVREPLARHAELARARLIADYSCSRAASIISVRLHPD